MKAKDIMTPQPVSCAPHDSAQKAARLMVEHDCGVIPIVEGADRRLAGIVTDRDLSNAVVAEGKDAGTVRLKECMTGQVIAANEDDDTEILLNLMVENQIRRIPVCDKDDRLVGIVSIGDIIRQQSDIRPERIVRVLEEICSRTGLPSKTRPAPTRI
jgi:CBS domain-containing protein